MKHSKETLKLGDIIPNPKNPRFIRDSNFKTLVKSIQDFPEMLKAREIVVDENNVILGGNMRYKALVYLKYDSAEVIRVSGLTDEKKDEFIIKDNINYGVWDWDILANEFDAKELKQYGLNVWQPDEANVVVDEDFELDFDEDVSVEEAIEKPTANEQVVVVEFDIQDYPEAFELSKFALSKGHNLGEILLEILNNNYEEV